MRCAGYYDTTFLVLLVEVQYGETARHHGDTGKVANHEMYAFLVFLLKTQGTLHTFLEVQMPLALYALWEFTCQVTHVLLQVHRIHSWGLNAKYTMRSWKFNCHGHCMLSLKFNCHGHGMLSWEFN